MCSLRSLVDAITEGEYRDTNYKLRRFLNNVYLASNKELAPQKVEEVDIVSVLELRWLFVDSLPENYDRVHEAMCFVNRFEFEKLYRVVGPQVLWRWINVHERIFWFEKIGRSCFVLRLGLIATHFSTSRRNSITPYPLKYLKVDQDEHTDNDSLPSKFASRHRKGSSKPVPEIVRKIFYWRSTRLDNLRQLPFFDDYFLDGPGAKVHSRSTQVSGSELSKRLPEIRKKLKCISYERLLDKNCPLIRFNNKHAFDNLMTKATDMQSVCAFVREILYVLIPKSLFGNNRTRNAVYLNLKLLVTAGINVKLRLSNLMRNVCVDGISWLEYFRNDAQRKSAFQIFVHEIGKYFIEVIRTCFYVTESSKTRLQPVYFRYDVWNRLCDLKISGMLKQNVMIPIEKTHGDKIEKDTTRQHALSRLRFIPKANDLRMINRLYKLDTNTKQKFYLKEVLAVLQSLKRDVQQPFKKFRRVIQSLSNSREKFFVIRADIQNCYPCIDREAIFKICDKLIRNQYGHLTELYLHRMNTFSLCRKFSRFDVRCQIGVLTQPYFDVKQGKKWRVRPNTIVQTTYFKERKISAIIGMLKNFIDDVVINDRCKYYRVKQGLRQGGMLSSELCNLYMNEFVSKYFDFFDQAAGDQVIVASDDLLFVSKSKAKIDRALQILVEGAADMNLYINKNKLRTNFANPFTHREQVILFSRFAVNFDRREIRYDYSSFRDVDISYSFTYHPYQSFRRTAHSLFGKCILLLIMLVIVFLSYIDIINVMLRYDLGMDERYNKELVIVQNIFEIGVVQSARLNSFLTTSPLWRSQQNALYITSFTIKLAEAIYKCLKKRISYRKLRLSMVLSDIIFVFTNATIKVWQWATPHRQEELQGLRKLLNRFMQEIGMVVNENVRNAWKKWYDMFCEYDIDLSLGIIMPHSLHRKNVHLMQA